MARRREADLTPRERAVRDLVRSCGYPDLARLADFAGLDRHTVYWVMGGRQVPQPRTVRLLAAALRVRAADLERLLETARRLSTPRWPRPA